MTHRDYADRLATMAPGECRWIGREDLHVYCMGSRIDGRYRPDVRQFKLVTAGRPFASADNAWTTATDVARAIQKAIIN